MSREIKTTTQTITPVPVDASFEREPAGWLLAAAKQYDPRYLLAHADDGVIWGRVEGNRLVLSGEVFKAVSPPLRAVTLQQARLFGPRAELLLWRDEEGWRARLVEDGNGRPARYYDEAQVLWGNNRQPESSTEFTLVADGEMGHRHAVPLAVTGAQFSRSEHPYRPLRLTVRHYLTQDDESGLLTVRLSRLTHLYAEEAK